MLQPKFTGDLVKEYLMPILLLILFVSLLAGADAMSLPAGQEAESNSVISSQIP